MNRSKIIMQCTSNNPISQTIHTIPTFQTAKLSRCRLSFKQSLRTPLPIESPMTLLPIMTSVDLKILICSS